MTEQVNIQETKKKMTRKKRRIRMKKRFIVFLFLLACSAIILTVLKAPFFNVKTIICVGQQNLTEEQIIEIAGAKLNVNIFSSGVKTMKKNLWANPAIEDCNVRRLFPNKIKIWVRESKAVTCVEVDGLALLCDRDGQIIKVVDARDTEAIGKVARLTEFNPAAKKVGESIIDPQNASHKKTFECVAILNKLEILDKVTAISAENLSDIRLVYDDRLDILLGDYDRMDYKLTFIKKVIQENLSEYEKAILDYRGKNLYVGPRTTAEEEKTDDENAESGEAATSPEEGADKPEEAPQDEKPSEE